jgi:hypothetical protein
MIKDIINLLTMSEYYGVSKKIDIAKGMYKVPSSFKEAGKQLKRIYKSKI